MSDVAIDDEEVAKKPSKLPLIIGLVLALVGGGGGFFVMSSGMLSGGDTTDSKEEEPVAEAVELPSVGFVEVPPLVVSLGPNAQAAHLRFRASLEVPNEHVDDVTNIMPRVQDVLNGYLRALDPSDLEAPGALIRLRGQMLRRVQLVVGKERIRDLLVLEFVLS